MAIENVDQLVAAVAGNFSPITVEKASLANAAAAQWHSLWRATGQPGQGVQPTAAAVCDNTTVGGLPFTQQTAAARSYLAGIEALCANAGTTLEIHDRLVHMAGLSGTVTTAQTVGIDLSTLLATSNLAARIGLANYSEVQWWLEWYADTGGTGVTATVAVTYNDGTTGNLTAVSLGATRRASFMQLLNSLIPAADSGKFIRAVTSVTLSATTGAAGNFGVTATRRRAQLYKPVANAPFDKDWARLRLPEIANAACLSLIQIANATSTGIVRATGTIAHG